MADLLGARPAFTDANSVARWSSVAPDTTLPRLDLDPQTQPNAHVMSPFPVREDLNSKIAIW